MGLPTSISATGSRGRARWTTRPAFCRNSASPPTDGSPWKSKPRLANEVVNSLTLSAMMIAAISDRQRRDPARRNQFAHLAAVGGEHHQRHDRERQLQAQDHLAQDQELRGPLLAVPDR